MAAGRKTARSKRTAGTRPTTPSVAPATGPVLGRFDQRQFEKSPSPMCIFDRETLRCLAANDGALRLYGYPRDEFLGLALSDTRHPGDGVEPAVVRDGSIFPRHIGTRRHLRKSGDVFVADVVVHDVVFDERSAILMLLLEGTDRSRTHMQWLEREQLFSALVEHSPDVIARIDRDLRHVYVNPAASNVTGIAPEQLIGRSEKKAGVPLELCVRWAAGARRAFATGKQQEVEITFPTPEGERCYVSHMVPEVGPDGQVQSVLAIARDVTDRKRAEEDRLSFVSRQRDAFIREVHHRVKNNLQGVVGLLRQLGSMHGSVQPLLDKAVSQLQALAVVHGLHGREWRDNVNLHGLIEEIARSVERTSGVRVLYEGGADDSAGLTIRETDGVSIALVLNELMSNAAKHSRRDRAVKVSLATSNDTAAARVYVTNDGDLPGGFDFERRAGLGTGLDLVRTLLPQEGAQLAITQGEGRVEAILNLDTPVLERGTPNVQEMPHAWDRRKRPYSDRRR